MKKENTHKWRVHVKNLETIIGVGIHAHELTPQRIIVNATVEGQYPVKPQDISQCFNYDNIYQLVANDWTKKTHTQLLEQCVVELLTHIFKCDARVDFASVRICKPDIFHNVETVGVETSWTRAEFESFCG